MKENVAEAIRMDPGGWPLRLLEGIRPEGLERSFKMSAETLLSDRYLFGIHKSDITPARLFGICEQMGMPDEFVPGFRERAQDANAFHVGFEGRGGGGLYKVYLESAHRLRPGATAPVLLHLAYKWDCLDSRAATIATYTCHPGLSVEAIALRLAGAGACETAARILGLAAARAAEPPMYLEVAEEGNPRASFDLNLHAAGLRVDEVQDLLVQACARYGIPLGRFEALCGRIAHCALGHISGGTSREGRDFLTVYYTVDRL